MTFRCLAHLGIRVPDKDVCVLRAKALLTGTLRIVHTAVAGLALCCLARCGIRVCNKALLTMAFRVGHATVLRSTLCCLTYFVRRVFKKGVFALCAKVCTPGALRFSYTAFAGLALRCLA